MHTIMIVENETIEREALKIFLNRDFKHTFNKIIEAKNGSEAIKKSKKYKPDLIIMNIEISEINGIDTQKEILSFSPKVNTIFISAHSNFEYAQQALKLNVKDYLLKPVRFSTLKDSINKIISNMNKNILKNNSYLYLNKSQSDVTKKAIIYMNKNFQNKITLDSIANEIHINSQYLSRLFKKEIGISYSDYLNTLRINKACSLLVNTSYTNYRIAIDSGFSDSAYFSKVFTKHIKITPSKYRKTHLDNKHKILSSN